MKIVFLCPYYGIVNRGVEARVFHLKAGFENEYGWSVDVFTLGKSDKKGVFHIRGIRPGSLLDNFLFRAFRKIGITSLSEPGYIHNASVSINAFPTLLFKKYDVIINFAGFWGGRVCSLIRNIKGTPNIISGAGGIGKPDLDNAKTKPDIFIASSPFTEQWLNKELPQQKTITIPNFVDTRLFRPIENIKKEYDILFAGAIEPNKRPQLAIEAAAKAGLSLLMIGDGSIKNEIEEQGRQLLKNRFSLIQAPHTEMPKYYNQCRVFTLPTNEEPFGIVFLEAMACNIPVVANNYETTKWIIKDAGICCDCADVDEYAASFIKAKEYNYGNKPITRAQDFDINKILTKWKEVIEGLVHEKI